MDETSDIVVMVMLSMFAICGIIGNSLVLYIYSHKKEKSTAGIFIMSLAGTDLFTCLFIMPYTEAVVYLDYYLRYDAACKIYMFFITCNIPFAAFIMVAIAMDRYFCICHPFLHVLNIYRSKVIVLVLLFIASTFGVITALAHGVYSNEQVVNGTPAGQATPLDNHVTLLDNHVTSLDSHVTPIADPITVNTTGSLTQDRLASIDTLYRSWLNKTFIDETSKGESTVNSSQIEFRYHGYCYPSFNIIGSSFLGTYQIIYAGTYILSFIIVVVLYGLIYRSIHAHRAKRNKRKRSSLYPSSAGIEYSNAETQLTAVTHLNNTGSKRSNQSAEHNDKVEDNVDHDHPAELQPMRPKPPVKHKALSIKEKTLLANIRTAVMLFVVTIVFLFAFLPAWLMASGLLHYNQIVFYMYFVYHTANPFIYAFMNKSFRDDLGKVIKCQSMPMVR